MFCRNLFGFQLRSLRRYALTEKTHFQLFPKSFPAGGPPKDAFQVNPRLLRREYRALQSQNHPDVVMGSSAFTENTASTTANDSASLAINNAYTMLKNPYTRAAYIIQLQHPDHIDITQDEVSKEFIAKVQASSEQSLNYKELLMTVLEAHEALELATLEADLEHLEQENSAKMLESEQKLEDLLQESPVPWEQFIIETIRLKYWVNIANGIKEWEAGKPVLLTH